MANFVKLNGYDVEDTIAREKINNIGNFSTSESNTGKTWIDNKPIYRKVINTGAVSNESVTVEHGITNIDKFISVTGVGYTISQNKTAISLPAIATDLSYVANPFATDTYVGISITDNEDVGLSDSYVIIEYTKTN